MCILYDGRDTKYPPNVHTRRWEHQQTSSSSLSSIVSPNAEFAGLSIRWAHIDITLSLRRIRWRVSFDEMIDAPSLAHAALSFSVRAPEYACLLLLAFLLSMDRTLSSVKANRIDISHQNSGLVFSRHGARTRDTSCATLMPSLMRPEL